MPKPRSVVEHLILVLVFGLLFAYSLHGAVTGSLYVPSKYHTGGTVVSGWAAWSVAASFAVLYFAMLAQGGRLAFTWRDSRWKMEYPLLIVGLLLLGAGIASGHHVRG